MCGLIKNWFHTSRLAWLQWGFLRFKQAVMYWKNTFISIQAGFKKGYSSKYEGTHTTSLEKSTGQERFASCSSYRASASVIFAPLPWRRWKKVKHKCNYFFTTAHGCLHTFNSPVWNIFQRGGGLSLTDPGWDAGIPTWNLNEEVKRWAAALLKRCHHNDFYQQTFWLSGYGDRSEVINHIVEHPSFLDVLLQHGHAVLH